MGYSTPLGQKADSPFLVRVMNETLPQIDALYNQLN